jgi:hypothetical protein
MQRSPISQHIQMGSIGISDTTSVDSPCRPEEMAHCRFSSARLGRMTCRQRGGADSSAIGHLTDVDSLRTSALRHKWSVANSVVIWKI